MKNNHVIEYDVTQAVIEELQKEQDDILHKYNQSKKISIVKDAKKRPANLRIAIEKRRKEYKADALEYGRRVDSEAKKVSEPIIAIEDNYKKIIEEYNNEIERIEEEKRQKEQDRIDNIKNKINEILNSFCCGDGFSSNEIETELKCFREEKEKNKDFDFQEFRDEFESNFIERENYLISELDRRRKIESEQKKLEEQRKKDEAERAKLEAEKAEFERKQREAQEKIEAQQREIERQKQEAERDEYERKQAELERQRQLELQKQKEELERQRKIDEENRLKAQKEEEERLAKIAKEEAERKLLQEKEDNIRNHAFELLDAFKHAVKIIEDNLSQELNQKYFYDLLQKCER